MAKSIEVVLSSFSKEPSAPSTAKVLVSKDNLIQLTGALDDSLCIIESLGDSTARREACLSVSPTPLKKSVAQITKAFREACGFGAADKCRITVASDRGRVAIPEATDIVVEDVPKEGLVPLVATPDDVPSWIPFLEEKVDEFSIVFPGLVVRDVRHKRTRRDFRIKTINRRADNAARFSFDTSKTRLVSSATLPFRPATPATPASPAASPRKQKPLSSPVKISQPATTSNLPTPPVVRPKHMQLSPIAGLESAVAELNIFLRIFDDDVLPGPTQPCSVVIQGDEGTGKTKLLNCIADAGWGPVFRLQPSDKLSSIQETLQKASEQFSVVLLDDIHELLAEERTNRAAIIRLLGEFLDKHMVPGGGSINGSSSTPDDELPPPQVVVLVACKDYSNDIPKYLQRFERLSRVITTLIPDAACRQAILRSLNMPLPPESAEAMIKQWSLNTHAFNGHDLLLLYCRISDMRGVRYARQVAASGGGQEEKQWAYFTEEDFKAARKTVHPSLMKGIHVKPPPVYWNQIHGQDDLVRALKRAVDMMNHPENFRTPPDMRSRGFLLYGPPGCSKTMAAQALATESGLNYFSVKGGELLNQYVGESERAIRDLFQRANRAAPAVIFLDEVDGLGGRRSDFGDKSAASGRGPQMVPALLSEMDGFEALSKILVVAATNRPETIDPALLRNGRFDSLFYVPPPNKSARRAILQNWADRMQAIAVDLDHVAERTERYSGAEIVGICKKVLDRVDNLPRDSDITTDMFDSVLKTTPRSITDDMLEHFSQWHP